MAPHQLGKRILRVRLRETSKQLCVGCHVQAIAPGGAKIAQEMLKPDGGWRIEDGEWRGSLCRRFLSTVTLEVEERLRLSSILHPPSSAPNGGALSTCHLHRDATIVWQQVAFESNYETARPFRSVADRFFAH